jgi:FMN phosphatase YigB (HAD superfamily)
MTDENNDNKNEKYFIFDLDETLYKLDKNYTITSQIDKQLLDKLSKIGKIILFSNASYSHCIYWIEVLDIKDYFSSIFSSDIIKYMKPNPLSYKKVVELAGIKPYDKVYFFDDISINLLSGMEEYKWNIYLINKKNDISNLNCKQFNTINNAISYILDTETSE